MGTWDVRLISASSITIGEEPVIELFGRTRTKESIVILCRGYLPYLYAVDPREGMEEILNKDQEVVSTERDRLLYKSEMHDVLKVTLRNPWKVTDFRNRFRKAGHDVLSADITFHHRFFYDMDMGSCIRVTGEIEEGKYNTDLVVGMSSFENIDSFDPGLRILSFDIENSIEHEFIYTICAVVGEDGEMRECEPLVGTEKEIITILRAVHKYKDSREQFEYRTHKRLIDIVKPSQKVVDALMNIELPAGVEIEVKL